MYSVLALGSINSSEPDFVPHLSTSVAEALLLVDLGVLIYFIHHIAKSIQLPEVIAGIARDLIRPIEAEFPQRRAAVVSEIQDVVSRSRGRQANLSGVPWCPHTSSGYIQYVGYSQLIEIATWTDSVIRLGTGRATTSPPAVLATVWPRGWHRGSPRL